MTPEVAPAPYWDMGFVVHNAFVTNFDESVIPKPGGLRIR
jgi:hypothetical protein